MGTKIPGGRPGMKVETMLACRRVKVGLGEAAERVFSDASADRVESVMFDVPCWKSRCVVKSLRRFEFDVRCRRV